MRETASMKSGNVFQESFTFLLAQQLYLPVCVTICFAGDNSHIELALSCL